MYAHSSLLGALIPHSRERNLGCPEDKAAAPRERAWAMPMQISAIELSVLDLFRGGGACAIQDLRLLGVGHARRGSPHEGRPARPDPGSSASWACAVGGQALQLGGAYSFRGGACEELNTRHRGLRRGGAYGAGPRVAGVGPATRG